MSTAIQFDQIRLPAEAEDLRSEVRAFLREDGPAALDNLGAIERLSRRLGAPDAEHYGQELVNYDTAFHQTIDRTRELSRRPELDDAFNHFVYIQRACVACHRIARRAEGGDDDD